MMQLFCYGSALHGLWVIETTDVAGNMSFRYFGLGLTHYSTNLNITKTNGVFVDTVAAPDANITIESVNLKVVT